MKGDTSPAFITNDNPKTYKRGISQALDAMSITLDALCKEYSLVAQFDTIPTDWPCNRIYKIICGLVNDR